MRVDVEDVARGIEGYTVAFGLPVDQVYSLR